MEDTISKLQHGNVFLEEKNVKNKTVDLLI